MKAQPVPEGVDKVAAVAERRSQVLDNLIAEKLLEAEVRKLRIDVTAAEVERIVASTKAENNLTDESFKIALGRQGMTIDEYKEQLKKQLTKMKIVQLKVKNRVNVSDAEVKTAQMQKAKAAQVLGFTKVRARHILWLAPASASLDEIEAQKKKALTARGRLEGGADFAEMAAAESEDPGSKSRGGDLGTFGRGEMVPEFERAAFEAPVGKVVGPVRSPFGWHLIIVDERVSPVDGDAAGAIESLREQMYQKETEIQFMQYIDELRREAFIEKRL
jgi:parvulin-like peptidyl-prolyl isomerase